MASCAPLWWDRVFYYYGAKARLAKHYPKPVYRTIVEPFAGAAGYSVHHVLAGAVDRLVLVEKDARVANLWRRLLLMSPEEILAYPEPLVGSWTNDFFVMTAATSNALARCRGFKVTPRTLDVFASMRRRVARVRLAMERVTVEVIEDDYRSAPDLEATWFIDPPYRVQGHLNKTVYPQGMGYKSGCDSRSVNYMELAHWCRERKGQAIVCEHRGADWLPFRPLYETTDGLGQPKSEVVWVGDQ